MDITSDGKDALIRLAKGDMRKVINILQSCAMAFDQVEEEKILVFSNTILIFYRFIVDNAWEKRMRSGGQNIL